MPAKPPRRPRARKAPAALTHFDASGQAWMVDVGAKPATLRRAIAEGRITMQPATLAMIQSGSSKKGDVLGIARIAAIQAAKQASHLVPLCHPLALTHVRIEFTAHSEPPSLLCHAEVQTRGSTGVEIEALCAVQIGLLTIYDMCKAIDRFMVMEDISLVEKSGGASGHWRSMDHQKTDS